MIEKTELASEPTKVLNILFAIEVVALSFVIAPESVIHNTK